MNEHTFFKYRAFDKNGYWKKIFTHSEFWFSTPDMLDDKEEVSIGWKLKEHLIYEAKKIFNEIRNGTTILSLGQIHNNSDLWNRYGSTQDSLLDGFCVEADFKSFVNRSDLHLSKVNYTPSSAKLDVDLKTIHAFATNPDQTIRDIQSKLFLEKQCHPWAAQKEVRFLHFKNQAESSYIGRAEFLPINDIKKVYYYENSINPENLELLKSIIIQNTPHIRLVTL